MAKIVLGTTMSLDGFIADRHGDINPLYPDLDALRQSEFLQESIRRTGAALMGRRTYDLGQGDYTGYEYQVPIFVLTHHPPAQAAKGENERLKFIFVTDGVESAVRQARAAAGDGEVQFIGGANTAQQILRLGLFDELEIGIRPILLGEGLRFFAPDAPPLALEKIGSMEAPGATYLRYRVIKGAPP